MLVKNPNASSSWSELIWDGKKETSAVNRRLGTRLRRWVPSGDAVVVDCCAGNPARPNASQHANRPRVCRISIPYAARVRRAQVPQLRHTLALNVADVQPDLRVLQQILGHVSITSAQVDLRHAEAGRLRSAVLDVEPASVRPGRGA